MHATKLSSLLLSLTLISGAVLLSCKVSALYDASGDYYPFPFGGGDDSGAVDDTSVVDRINITVPVSCTISGTGMNTHNANINNGIYTPDIGTTTLHAFCNDSEGFAIYAAGYTGNEVGGINSNKLVGTNASNNATIETGLATTAGNPDISNWVMKLAITQDSGDTTGTNAFTIDSAPNTLNGADASFSSYHTVPNEYTKVAHKDSNTDMATNTGGVKLTTTYAAYISKTQPADTYSGQVIYTLVHPASAAAPVGAGKIGVTYNANGSTFSGGDTTNMVVYAMNPMYEGTTAEVLTSSNVSSNGTQSGAYTSSEDNTETFTFSGASKVKVVLTYDITAGSAGIAMNEGAWTWDDGVPAIDIYSDSENLSGQDEVYIFDGNSVTIYMDSWIAPDANHDYGMYARVYPVYITEQSGTIVSTDLYVATTDTGTYATTTDWYDSWYADINNTHYDFMDETELKDFLEDNMTTFSGTNIDLYRSLTFNETYAKANKTQSSGYYVQQDLNKVMCQTVAMGQNSTVKDIRDGNIYMIGRLKDGNCWMLDNLALDPTDSTTAQNMNSTNTNAAQEAITNLLNGGSITIGWSSMAVADVDTEFGNGGSIVPRINNASKDTLVTSYGPASVNGQAKVGVYYNFCAASVSTYCYGSGVDIPGTLIDVPQDICPANWRMPTGGMAGEYEILVDKYDFTQSATSPNSLQYNLSTPLSGSYNGSSALNQGNSGYWWSSTYWDSYGIATLNVHFTSVGPLNRLDRYMGLPIRCLVSE